MAKISGVRVVRPQDGTRLLSIIEGTGEAVALVWPGMGARFRSMHRISLGAGACTVALQHPGEAVYTVLAGGGHAVDPSSGERFVVTEGSMVHLGPATSYTFEAGPDGCELVGGPCPPDPDLYRPVTPEGET